MELLVLGGTHFVGRSVVEAALHLGHNVTTVNRGVSGPPASGAAVLLADRLDPGGFEAALGTRSWHVVVDTWSGAPRAVQESATKLTDRVDHYVYVSSRSVYQWPIPVGADEAAPVVVAEPGSSDGTDYASNKRGGELAVLEAFGTRALVARAGLILGPYELIGRLPWWLRRLERGGRVLAPGPIDRPLQYIDGRDLADWLIEAGQRHLDGVYNTVSRPGHTTMGELLACGQDVTGGSAELVWLTPERIAAAGIEPWIELPIWLPPTGEYAGLHDGDVSAALAHGLRCRSIAETVADTWAWLQAEGDPPPLSHGALGLDPAREAALLAAENPEPQGPG